MHETPPAGDARPAAPTDAQRTLDIISHLPLFQQLDAAQLSALAEGVALRRLDKGEWLLRRGEPAEACYAVAYGQIKLFMVNPQGQEKVVELIHPGQSLGEAVMFLRRPYPVTAEALQDSLVLRIGREAIDHLLATDASFARRMLAGLSVRLHALIRDVETYAERSSTQRVVGYLLQQCEAVLGDGDDRVAVDLPAHKQVIASRLNLTPESLSRAFLELTKAGLIQVDGRTIHLHSVHQLRSYQP